MLLNLTDHSAEPLYCQISGQILKKVVEGDIPGGTCLPPVRVLARENRVSRSTVERAYRKLADHGIIEPGPESGHFVACLSNHERQAVLVSRPKEYLSQLGAIESLDKRRVEEELRMAHELQAALLPKAAELQEGYLIAAYTAPCRTVGGDFYDYFPIDETRIGLVIADASGKGMPAAILVSQIQAILKIGVGNGDTIGQTLKDLNSHLERNTSSMYFATLFYGVCDRVKSTLEYANAGHDFPVLVHEDGAVEMLESTGTALGVLPEFDHKTETIRIQSGDSVLFYTDGITETMDLKGDYYGEQRLRNLFIRNRHRSPREIIDLVKKDLDDFHGSATLQDDRTLMILKVLEPDRGEPNAA